MKVVKVLNEDYYINVEEIKDIRIVRTSISYYDLQIYTDNESDYTYKHFSTIYRTTYKEDCENAMKVLLNHINNIDDSIIDLKELCNKKD